MIGFGRNILAATVLITCSTLAAAQDWVRNQIDDGELDCGIVQMVSTIYGGEMLVREGAEARTLHEYFEVRVPEYCLAYSPIPARDQPAPRWDFGSDGREWNCDLIDALSMAYLTLKVARDETRELSLADYFGERAPTCVDQDAVAEAVATLVFIPDWTRDSSGRYEFNCETILLISDVFGQRDFLRDEREVRSFRSLHRSIAGDCFNFHGQRDDNESETPAILSVKKGTYLRACAKATCSIVGRASSGTVLRVLGEFNDWTHVAFRDGSAYVATRLTRRDNRRLLEQSDHHAIVTEAADLRDCPASTCGIVGEAAAETIWEVVDTLPGWQELLVSGGTAFVEARFTEPGPDTILFAEQSTYILADACLVVTYPQGGPAMMGMHFTFAGERRADLRLDLFRPVDRYQLQLADPSSKVFSDDNEQYRRQSFAGSDTFPAGLYVLEFELDGAIERVGFNADGIAIYEFHVYC